MHDYDVTLKLLMRASARVAIREIAGAPIYHWLNAELPKSQNLRMDLLGETVEGEPLGTAELERSSYGGPHGRILVWRLPHVRAVPTPGVRLSRRRADEYARQIARQEV